MKLAPEHRAWLVATLLGAALGAWVGVALMTTLPRAGAPATLPMATVDVGELYRLKERKLTERLLRSDASQQDRALVLQEAADFGAALDAAIAQLPLQCHCLVLARGAVLASEPDTSLTDLTPGLRKQLGLEARANP